MGAKIKIFVKWKKLIKKIENANIKSLGHAARYIRTVARNSIKPQAAKGKKPQPAKPGYPARTKRGQLRKSILYALVENKEIAVIGASHGVMGRSAKPHEHGGNYKGFNYEARPFMVPALEQNLHRLPKFWGNSLRR